jgi:hypothetical protein
MPAAPAAPTPCSTWPTRCCAPRPSPRWPTSAWNLPTGAAGAALCRAGQGRIEVERLRDLLAGSLPDADPRVFAVDVTTWPRCDAECSQERGYYSHPSRHSAGQPIIAGWASQWIAQLGFDRDSWTAPVDAARLHPLDDTDQQAAVPVRARLGRLPDGGPVPLMVVDAGDDSAQLSLDLAEARVAVLVRLRADRCLLRRPATTTTRHQRPTAAPRRQVRLHRPDHLAGPTATLVCQDDQYGTVTVAAGAGLHPKQQRHPDHGTRGPRPIVRGTILRVQVQRVPAKTRPPKLLWLWWAGCGELDLDLAWRAYLRRFDLEHTVRFAKPTLGWTTPRPRHPEQADRWTWLVLAADTQLRLARAIVADARLPWERPRPPGRLSPVRVCRGFPRLLVRLGSPAAAPKPAGRSPGRPKGSRCGPAMGYPAIKQPTKKASKKPTTATKAA